MTTVVDHSGLKVADGSFWRKVTACPRIISLYFYNKTNNEGLLINRRKRQHGRFRPYHHLRNPHHHHGFCSLAINHMSQGQK